MCMILKQFMKTTFLPTYLLTPNDDKFGLEYILNDGLTSTFFITIRFDLYGKSALLS